MIPAVATATAVEHARAQRRRRLEDARSGRNRGDADSEAGPDEDSRSISSSDISIIEKESGAPAVTSQHSRRQATLDIPEEPTRPSLQGEESSTRQALIQPSEKDTSSGPAPAASSQPQLSEPPSIAPPFNRATQPLANYPVSTLVNKVLELTRDKFSASARVQRKLAEEEGQGVIESADESDRRGRQPRSKATQPAAPREEQTAAAETAPEPPQLDAKADKLVENVYTFDLFEENPTWAGFLKSNVDQKKEVWRLGRQQATNGCQRCLYHEYRQWIYMTLSYPDFSRLAYWAGVFIMTIILLNTITFCIESVPNIIYVRTNVNNALGIVDYVCLGIFTVEYLLRLACCPNLFRFLRSFSNTIDLVAILPFYIEYMVTGSSGGAEQTRIVRLLRLLRVLRIVKSMPRLRHLTLVVDTLRTSVDVLIMLAFLLTVLLVVFGTIFFFVEPVTFDSIPAAMYYAQVTFTTTGYGDITPVTPWGRFVAGAAMLLCMVVLSLPIAVIGGNFSEKWADYKSFKAAVDRSARVCPKARKLKGLLKTYEEALDDVIGVLQKGEDVTETQMAIMRKNMAAARAELERGGAKDVPKGAPPPAEGRTGLAASVLKYVGRSFAGSINGSLARRTGGGGSPTSGSRMASIVNLAMLGRSTQGAGNGSVHGSIGAASAGAEAPAGAGDVSVLAGQQKGAAAPVASPGASPAKRRFRGLVNLVARERTRMAAMSTAAEASRDAAEAPDRPDDNEARVSLTLDPEVKGDAERTSDGSRLVAVVAEASVAPPQPMPPPPAAAPPPAPPAPPPILVQNDSLASSMMSPPGGAAPHIIVSPSVVAVDGAKLPASHSPRQVMSIISALASKKTYVTLAKRMSPAGVVGGGGGGGGSFTAKSLVSPVDPKALAAASEALAHAQEACERAQDERTKRKTLATLARLLRAGDVPDSLEKLQQQYRVLRCWQEELPGMAENMWGVRDALDRLAWTLQQGLKPEDYKYKPACPKDREDHDWEVLKVKRQPADMSDLIALDAVAATGGPALTIGGSAGTGFSGAFTGGTSAGRGVSSGLGISGGMSSGYGAERGSAGGAGSVRGAKAEGSVAAGAAGAGQTVHAAGIVVTASAEGGGSG